MSKSVYEIPCLFDVNDVVYGNCGTGSHACNCAGCTNGGTPTVKANGNIYKWICGMGGDPRI